MSDPHVRVRLFGAPRVERDGAILPFGRQKGMALLAILSAELQPHSREKLLDLLWPLFGPDDARNNLRRELSLLRGVLGGERLLADRQTIALDTAAVSGGQLEIDVHTFESLLAEVQAHDDSDDAVCAACAGRLVTAARIYTDHFLAGFALPDSAPFDEWQFFHSERLRGLLATGLRRLAGQREATGQYDAALEYARRWLALDPLHEPAHRALMRLYGMTGQHAAALRQYDTLARALHIELGVAPEPETEALREAVGARRLTAPPTKPLPVTTASSHRPPYYLPAETTPFVGRQQELAALETLLADSGVRLITIMGVGGMGKTRLALASAARQLAAVGYSHSLFPDGVFWVPLAPLEQPSQIVAAVARAVDFSFHAEHEHERQLADFLRERRLLLLLDNFEHLVGAASMSLLTSLLEGAPGLKILATSRVRLGARGEHLFPLGGLDYPAPSSPDTMPPEALDELCNANSALALFCQSARRVQPGFAPDASNLPSLLRICELVGGMPLGIELAAGWLEVLSVGEIATEIERSLDFLESDWHDLPERQSSMRAVFDTSWKLLTAEEQAVLTALTVFRGGFNRAAAEAVAGASLKLLLSLRMKSWLQLVEPDRYQIHELLRQYASEGLRAQADAAQRLRQQHAVYFARYLGSLEPGMRGRKPGTAYVGIEVDLDNIQAALEWLVDDGDLCLVVDEMLPALLRYLESRYRYFLFHPQLERARLRAEQLGMSREAGILLTLQSAFFLNGYPTRFMDYHWISSASGDIVSRAWAAMPAEPADTGIWSTLLAWQYGRFVDPDAAAERLRGLVDRFRQDSRQWETAFALQCLGRLLTPRPWDVQPHGAPGEARAILEEALQRFRKLDDEREEAVTLLFQSFERQAAGDMRAARDLAADAQARLYEMGDDIIAVTLNFSLAEIDLQLGDVEASLQLLHELADAYIRRGQAHLAIDGLSRESYEAVRYGDLEYALLLRERCLALSRAAGDLGYESWDSWEMGEVFRVRGDFAKAREWYERSHVLFQIGTPDYGENEIGQSFYYRGMGDLALIGGDPDGANVHYEKAARLARATQHTWQYAYVATGLGRAALMADKAVIAAGHLADALRVGWRTGDAGIMLATIAAASRLFALLGNVLRARELAERILAHPLAWNEIRADMARFLEIDTVEARRRKLARPFNLADDYARLLAELEAIADSRA